MNRFLLTLFGVALSFSVLGQSPKKMMKKIGDKPIFFIDSVNVDQTEMMKYLPEQIASITVYKDNDAIELMGEDGKDGVIYIETKDFARGRYWKYFTRKSNEYSELVKTSQPNDRIQYILNDRILTDNFEGNLSMIDDSIFKEIKIIDAATLEKDYKIENKDFGVIIFSDKPDNLYKAKKKF